MGFRVKLRGSNFEPLMSALGQKQTSELVQSMSALPPKAGIGEHGCDVRFVAPQGRLARRSSCFAHEDNYLSRKSKISSSGLSTKHPVTSEPDEGKVRK